MSTEDRECFEGRREGVLTGSQPPDTALENGLLKARVLTPIDRIEMSSLRPDQIEAVVAQQGLPLGRRATARRPRASAPGAPRTPGKALRVPVATKQEKSRRQFQLPHRGRTSMSRTAQLRRSD